MEEVLKKESIKLTMFDSIRLCGTGAHWYPLDESLDMDILVGFDTNHPSVFVSLYDFQKVENVMQYSEMNSYSTYFHHEPVRVLTHYTPEGANKVCDIHKRNKEYNRWALVDHFHNVSLFFDNWTICLSIRWFFQIENHQTRSFT